jgi:hypothetical protein
MSLSSSFPSGAPTLAEVVLQRTFAKPPQPFVDGEFIKALDQADDSTKKAAVARPQQTGSNSSDTKSGSGSGSPQGGSASTSSSAAATPGKAIDVRV